MPLVMLFVIVYIYIYIMCILFVMFFILLFTSPPRGSMYAWHFFTIINHCEEAPRIPEKLQTWQTRPSSVSFTLMMRSPGASLNQQLMMDVVGHHLNTKFHTFGVRRIVKPNKMPPSGWCSMPRAGNGKAGTTHQPEAKMACSCTT